MGKSAAWSLVTCPVCLSMILVYYFMSEYICISVLGSDVIYSEGAVMDLLATLLDLSGTQTTVILAGELRNGIDFRNYLIFRWSEDRYYISCDFLVADAILEYFLQAAAEDFTIGRVDQKQWHPDCCSPRVVIYVLVKNQRKL